MFYTLTSKIPLIPAGKNHFLMIFIIGSIAYVLLHYYLSTNQTIEIVDKFKGYLYYLMAIDLAIAFFLSKGTAECDDIESSKGYTKDEKKQIEQDLQTLRRTQKGKMDVYTQRAVQMQQEQQAQALYHAQQQAKQRDDDDEKSATKSNQSPFKTIDEAEEDDRREKEEKEARSKSSKSSKSTESSSSSERPPKLQKKKIVTKKDKRKKQDEEECDADTDIPVYGVDK